MGDIWLVRHTETDWNRERRYQSHSDRPLTRRGERQLRAVVDYFREHAVATVISTGLARTDRLAAAIVDRHAGARHVRDVRWREIDHGCWEGLTYGEVKRSFGARADARFADPRRSRVHRGETLLELERRVRAAWSALARRRRGGCVVVAHATPLQVIACRMLGVPVTRYWQVRIELGSVSLVRLGRRASVEFLSHTPLTELRAIRNGAARVSRRSREAGAFDLVDSSRECCRPRGDSRARGLRRQGRLRVTAPPFG
jgi:2,3-bisphosphoglycerate-dependent phosphoglycerate mutase/probable phosphoglycerate mutase